MTSKTKLQSILFAIAFLLPSLAWLAKTRRSAAGEDASRL